MKGWGSGPRGVFAMLLHKHLARPATALLVAAVGATLFALPATTLSTGSRGFRLSTRSASGDMSPSGLLFVENAGQWPEAARFQVWGSPAGGGTTWLAEDAIWVSIFAGSHGVGSAAFPEEPLNLPATTPTPTGLALKLTFPGSNPDVRIEPFDPLTTTVSYFLGNDPDSVAPGRAGVRRRALCRSLPWRRPGAR